MVFLLFLNCPLIISTHALSLSVTMHFRFKSFETFNTVPAPAIGLNKGTRITMNGSYTGFVFCNFKFR
jgi:hypothetical protein